MISKFSLSNNKIALYNLTGTILDKGLPMVISLIVSSYMSTETFGNWSLFYQFILIMNAVTMSSVMGFFSRKFYFNKFSQKMYIYNYPIVFFICTSAIIIYYLFFSPNISGTLIFELCIIISFMLYNYYAKYLRFKGEDFKYFISALSRGIIFSILIFFFIFINGYISYLQLVISFFASHLFIIINSIKHISFDPKKTIGEYSEFISLSSYGFLTSSVSGIDKFLIIALGNTSSFLAVYTYLLAISSSTNVLMETAKKIFTPKQFKEYHGANKLTSKTKKQIVGFFIVFLIVQLCFPVILFWGLKYLGLMNAAYASFELSYEVILIFSLGLYIFGIYHFLNPILLFFKKSVYMTIALSTSTIVYFILILILDENSIIDLTIAKSVMLGLSTFFTLLMIKKARL